MYGLWRPAPYIAVTQAGLCVISISLSWYVVPVFTQSFCDDGMQYDVEANVCIWKTSAAKTYKMALMECRTKNGTLGIIKGESTYKVMQGIKGLAKSDVWFGLQYSAENQSYYWQDDTELEEGSYYQLTPIIENSTCVKMHNQKWTVSDCDVKLIGVCTILDANICRKNNGDCEQTCVRTGLHMRKCKCGKIYTAKDDKCLARCDVFNGGCDQHCENTANHRICSCMKGYDQNGTQCIRNYQSKLLERVIVGITFGGLILCFFTLIVYWAVFDKHVIKRLPSSYSSGWGDDSYDDGEEADENDEDDDDDSKEDGVSSRYPSTTATSIPAGAESGQNSLGTEKTNVQDSQPTSLRLIEDGE